MRKLLICSLLLLSAAAALSAEPLVLEQAGNVLKQGVLEAGLANITYQTDETKFTDTTGAVAVKLTNASTVVPLYARYAFTPVIEGLLTLPYASVSSKNEPTGGSGDRYLRFRPSGPGACRKIQLHVPGMGPCGSAVPYRSRGPGKHQAAQCL